MLLEKNNDYFVTFFLTNLIATRYLLLTIQMLNETNDCWLTIVTNGNEITIKRISAHLCATAMSGVPPFGEHTISREKEIPNMFVVHSAGRKFFYQGEGGTTDKRKTRTPLIGPFFDDTRFTLASEMYFHSLGQWILSAPTPPNDLSLSLKQKSISIPPKYVL